MELAVPDIHFLFGSAEDSYTSISGSLSIPSTSTSTDQEIKIELIRCVESRWRVTSWYKKDKKSAISPSLKRKSIPIPALPFPSIARLPDAQTETLVQCRLWTFPNANDESRSKCTFEFVLPIPSYIPATAETALGTVSYAVTATTSSSAQTLRCTKPVTTQRLVQPKSILHTCRYPGDRVVTELWLAESTARKGARQSEVTYTVAKELRWSVDEAISLVQLGCRDRAATIYKKHVRRICTGREKGRWVASDEVNEERGVIEIPFEVHIPTAVETIDGASYRGHHAEDVLAIIVGYKLHLEVITGEDTFHRETGGLVDRRLRVKSYNAVFPLQVHHFSFNSDADVTSNPPRYEDSHPLLPTYTSSSHPDPHAT
ncbi:uncharacterized protein BDV17DRAFT_295569 [Aspergillus undulatus]|uniref:uncharacterized protein n=1 Tax=Aspergillus undulatus TaxID=1810928 RepID=UPI003CCD8020